MLGRVFLEFFVMDVHAEIYHANVAGLEDTAKTVLKCTEGSTSLLIVHKLYWKEDTDTWCLNK